MLLENLEILITRPLQQSLDLVHNIQLHGGIPIHFPTIEIQDTKTPYLRSHIEREINTADQIIFVSANAVTKVMALNIKLPPKTTILTIGAATAHLLKEHSVPVHFYPEQKSCSESLLQSDLLRDVANKKIVIFSGEGGRNLLSDSLLKRGATVVKIPVYKRRCPNIHSDELFFISTDSKTMPLVITCTSVEILQNLVTILEKANKVPWLKQQYLLTISPRIATHANDLGFNDSQIMIAENTSTQAMIETLITWYAKFV